MTVLPESPLPAQSLLACAKRWARSIMRDVAALWIAARDPRTPVTAKIVASAVVAYALSPIDLIPDFIPVIGYLDDLLVVPLGIMLACKLIPNTLMVEFRLKAAQRAALPSSRSGLAAIVLIWLFGAAGLVWLFRFSLFGH